MISIIFIIVIIVAGFSLDQPHEISNLVFHVTLADPNLYFNGVYTDSFILEKGEYSFRFVPNGSSPEILSITLNGKNLDFSEDFILQKTLHQTGISEYFTWKYVGKNVILISEKQEVSITINPNGNVLGSVSVDILQN